MENPGRISITDESDGVTTLHSNYLCSMKKFHTEINVAWHCVRYGI